MTDDRRGGSSGDDPGDRDAGIPPELQDVDEELRRVRFTPRSGLEDDVLARLPASGDEEREPTPVPPVARGRGAVRAAAVLVLVAAMGLLARVGAGGDGGSTAPVAADRTGSAPEDGFTLRWGSDARVVALGSGVTGERGSNGRGVRCGRIGDRLGCSGTEPGAAYFATARGPAVLRDFCCLDYDGGGPPDDGIRVVAGQGEAVVDFWIYEDLDGTGTFSEGDLLRTVVHGEGAARSGGGAPGRVSKLDRCCTDLDGGPRGDDGLFVLAAGGTQVALAVLYEDVTGDGRLSPGDRLRALRTTPLGEDPNRDTR